MTLVRHPSLSTQLELEDGDAIDAMCVPLSAAVCANALTRFFDRMEQVGGRRQ
jgi:hypothetical protein